jgi:hypothetical protein
MTEKEYNGWKNRATWNVALWVNNDQDIYEGAVEFMKDYKGISPYRTFMRTCGLQGQRTPDKILWVSQILDFDALNEMMKELKA